MAKKMLVDASQPEETRVVVVNGNRVEDFEFESTLRKQLKGNIYLARVTRVEPSLQAAFVEYGGNRHGFLPLSEIHPDYYQIPVADRAVLLEDEAANARADAEEDDRDDDNQDDGKKKRRKKKSAKKAGDDKTDASDESAEEIADNDADTDEAEPDQEENTASPDDETSDSNDEPPASIGADIIQDELVEEAEDKKTDTAEGADDEDAGEDHGDTDESASDDEEDGHIETVVEDEDVPVDEVTEDPADDVEEEVAPRRRRARRRAYRIQEVIKRRQILLIQVVKEERGNKGAALTTYLSIAGRYCVLMPNTARGGGISRKIVNGNDRRRLKDVARELDVPQGMGLIVRTAGAKRTKSEIKRDFEYLLRLWESIRDLTLKSVAPALIYEEGSLIQRAIRDLYNKDVDSILVEGESGYRDAKAYMKMLMPSHAKNVQHYDDRIPLFLRYQVEQQLGSMFEANVTLKSGGYLVINPTEALVSIDVNSGRSTKERNVEATAVATNLEAAEEISRQLRLRDLAGLIVIDFIDMDEPKNNRAVERKLKDCLKNDRARIQVGRISHFGLMEMSRQRLGSSLLETHTRTCPHCNGTGIVRTDDSTALQILRALEEEGMRGRAAEIGLTVHESVAIYILNHKRDALADIEARGGFRVLIRPDKDRGPQDFEVERLKSADRRNSSDDEPAGIQVVDIDMDDEPEDSQEQDQDNKDEKPKRRRRGGRGRKRGGNQDQQDQQDQDQAAEDDQDAAKADDDQAAEAAESSNGDAASDSDGDEEKKPKRRRGRRGGRRRKADSDTKNDENGADGDSGNQSAAKETKAEDKEEKTTSETAPELSAESDATPEANAVDEKSDADPNEAASEKADDTPDPSRPRRRGWWQRRGS